MSEKQITGKKKILDEMTLQLSGALTNLKDTLGEKKFNKRIRKAAKLLVDGIKPAEPVIGSIPAPAPKAKETTVKAVSKTKSEAPATSGKKGQSSPSASKAKPAQPARRRGRPPGSTSATKKATK